MARAAIAAGLLGIALLSADARAEPGREPVDLFKACRERLANSPDEYDSAYCFYAAAFEARLWDEGVRVFEPLIRDRPDNFWLPLALGHLYRNRQPADLNAAVEWYQRSAAGFRAASHAEGEILARSNLRDLLLPTGRVADASAEVARVAAIGASSEDPLLKGRAWSLEASHLFDIGGDLGLANRLLKQAEQAVFPDGPSRLRRAVLNSLGRVALRLGRLDEAAIHFSRLAEQARTENDLQSRAAAQYNLLNTESMRESLLPSAGAKERLLQLARQTLAIGQTASHTLVTLKAHRIIAALLSNLPGSRDEALEHLERCLALATDARQQQDEAACAWMIAMLVHETSPRRARAAQVQAARATGRANTPVADALNAGRHMQNSWLIKPRPDAIRDSLDALDVLEVLRSLQDGPDSSAEVFSTWTLDYYWLSGRLLLDGDRDLDLAFSIAERLRARTLLEARERARTPTNPQEPAVAERRDVRRAIAAVQRTLMDPTLSAAARRGELDRLAALEAREQEAGRQIARLTQGRPRADSAFASLDDVQSALAPGEALLSFQVGIWDTIESTFGGGAWLTVVTRDRRTVHRIPDRTHFAPLVPVFTGLLAAGDGREIPAAVRLYGDVFSGALGELPPDVTRLILVPDGPLQQLPFDALRAAAGTAPLAARYELVVSPSATLWLDARRRGSRRTTGRILVLADPEVNAAKGAAAPERQGVLERGFTLGRLPYAQRESRALARYLVDVDTLIGPAASEQAIKTRALGDYELVHFAAHAVADEAHPDRSAVFLAPGDAGQDGLLQAREIGELDLDGKIVVLSACQTATGAVLSGEGVLSLARAFFQAGARAVVGTRWHIRDEDAASLFETFYRELGKGETLAAALAQTKANAMDRGVHPDVWSALVLLGDGASRPFSPRPPAPDPTGWIFAGLAVLVSAMMAGAFAATRHVARTTITQPSSSSSSRAR